MELNWMVSMIAIFLVLLGIAIVCADFWSANLLRKNSLEMEMV
jgi:hypothetical protein